MFYISIWLFIGCCLTFVGHLDSRKSIQSVLLVTSCVALIYSCTQVRSFHDNCANMLGTPVLGFMIINKLFRLFMLYKLSSSTKIDVIWLLRTSVQNIHHVINLTFTQGTLEFEYPDPRFHVEKGSNETYQNFDIFAHGGMIFLITSSLVFFLVSDGIFISGNRVIKLKQAHIWSNSHLFVRNI